MFKHSPQNSVIWKWFKLDKKSWRQNRIDKEKSFSYWSSTRYLLKERRRGKAKRWSSRRNARKPPKKVLTWIMDAAFISSSVASDISVSHSSNHLFILSSSSPLLIQDTPAILRHIKVKERRSLRDHRLTKTLHTPQHVTWSTIITLLSCFIQLLSASSRQTPVITIAASIPNRTRADPTETRRHAAWEQRELGNFYPDNLLEAPFKTGRFFISTVNILRAYYE